MAIADEIILDRLTAREAQLHEQTNAIDVKASILLVAVTFLAGQTTYLLTKHLQGFWRWEQFFAALVLFVGSVTLALLLRIRNYDGECAEDYPVWRDGLVKHYGVKAATDVPPQMLSEIVTGCKTRIDKAVKINEGKSLQTKWAYRLTLAAFALNLAVLLAPFFA
jgi:hypothetical protein